MSDTVQKLRNILYQSIDSTPDKASFFFKTGPNDYAHHDKFLGITAPTLRKLAKTYKTASLQIIEDLLQSKYNEERLLALFILVHQYQAASSEHQKEICHFYFNNLVYVNNWNLVDSSAHHILGHYLSDKDKSKLIELAGSDILWERRIAIVSTWYFIRKLQLDWTFKIGTILLHDPHDLIHKAVGWMLREAGKKDTAQLISFLSSYANQMPKTMLRYAIERLSTEQKSAILG